VAAAAHLGSHTFMSFSKGAGAAFAAALLGWSCSSTPPSATCSASQTACGSACAVLATDDAHCGTCDKACASGESCAASACYPHACGMTTCDPGAVCVSNACVDKSCVGVICPAPQSCGAGTCVCAAPALTCGGACVDPQTDVANCGACGKACDASELCAKGACYPKDCAGQVCGPSQVCDQNRCVDRACAGVICPGAETCANGTCGCNGASSTCAQACVDTHTDPGNCGMCGKACSASEGCAASSCWPKTCPPPDGGAVPVNCAPDEVCERGACTEAACVDVMCGPGQHCSGGACLCDAGRTACGSACVDLTSNPANCGACAHSCDSGKTCNGGACVVDNCMAPTTLCGTACVNLTTDANNCGACGAACGGGRNCVAGACQCPMGLTLCGTQCTNLQTDPANCARCSNSCNGGSCMNGGCSCSGGKSLCNGTCVDYATDLDNCQGCGKVCAAGQTCGASGCTCPAGQKACGTAGCIDITGDNLNCGDCGHACPMNQFCSAGTCQAPITCGPTFNPAASAWCEYMPLQTTACGAETQVGGPMSFGGTAAASVWSSTPLTANPGDRFQVQGTVQSTNTSYASTDTALRNAMGNYVGVQNVNVPNNLSQPDINFSVGSSPWPCAAPADIGIWTTAAQGASYNLTVTRYARERYNSGAITVGAATPLATVDGGMACDHVCGYVHQDGCADNSEYYRFTLPAHKAADVMVHFLTFSGACGYSGCSQGQLQVYTGGGALVCQVAYVQITPGNPADATGRIVNNTGQDQPIVLLLNSPVHEIGYSIVTAIEQ
jgi:hypothetical protein